MTTPGFIPLVESTRGPLVESIHYGSIAVVDASGRLVASVGDPELYANLRSSSKPFQTLPLVESGAAERLGLTDREVALTCASHSGTDDHVAVLRGMQAKIGVTEDNLLCGVHYPIDEETSAAMRLRGEEPTPARHNCSGKHTGMLGQAADRKLTLENYIGLDHPIQATIKRAFAEMCDLDVEKVLVGIDGCSAPTFAVPLRAAALAFARLADPSALPEPRAGALRRIARSMMANPDMVGGPERFDTLLMEFANGTVVAKGGAEGYQGMAVMPGALGPGSPALGITYKISDGDHGDRARPVVGIEVLRQLGALFPELEKALARFDKRPVYNWRKIEVGELRTCFTLNRA